MIKVVGARAICRFSFFVFCVVLLSAVLAGKAGAQERNLDYIGAVWTLAVYFKEGKDIQGSVEQVLCTVAEGSGRALIANGSPDEEAKGAFGEAVAALRSLVPLGYPLVEDFWQKYDITLRLGRGDLPHQGAGQGLAYAVAAYSAMTSTPILRDVAVVGIIDRQGNVRGVESVPIIAKAAVEAEITTLILPEENAADAAALPEEIASKLRIVLVRSLHRALFHCLGYYGPQGQTYLYLLEVYRIALSYLAAQDFEHAEVFFRELQGWMPEDMSIGLWLQKVKEQRLEVEERERLEKGKRLLYRGKLGEARKLIEECLVLRADSEAAQRAFEELVAVEKDSVKPKLTLNFEGGEEVSGGQEVVVRATDDHGILAISVFVDDEKVAEGTVTPLIIFLDTQTLVAGTHLLRAEVTDLAGNQASEEIEFEVLLSTT